MTNEYMIQDDAPISASNDQLKQIGHMLMARAAVISNIEQLEQQLKQANESLRQLEEVDIPAVMDEANLRKVETPDGKTVTIDDILYMSVPKKTKPALVSWLLANGHGALVQADVVVNFKKGEADKVERAIDLLAGNGFAGVHVEEGIHTGQLKALYKELRAEGVEVPDELFGAYSVRKAVIK